MELAPIALFVYNRAGHSRKVIEAVLANDLSRESELFIYSDAPRAPEHAPGVDDVRQLIKQIKGFKAVHIIERQRNYGCARSLITGITEVVNAFGSIIVVEDDVLVSPYFLKYMNEALEMYREDKQVACVHGYLYPLNVRLPETFFIKGADIWGWATWKRAWDLYEPDAAKLLCELKSRRLTKAFDFDGACNFTHMLKAVIAGKLDTWDVQWHATAFLKDMYTLYPGRSLVQNIGFDSSGTHCDAIDVSAASAHFSVEMSPVPIHLQRTGILENPIAREAIRKFHIADAGRISRLKQALIEVKWRLTKDL